MIAAPASPNADFRTDTATNCTHDVIQKISEMKYFATGKLLTFLQLFLCIQRLITDFDKLSVNRNICILLRHVNKSV